MTESSAKDLNVNPEQSGLLQTAAERLRGTFAESELAGLMGISADIIELDRVVLRMACAPPVMNTNGTINGGAMATLLDNATAAAAWATPDVRETTRGTTVSLNVNFIGRPGQGDAIAEARVISRGGTLTVIEADCHDEAGTLLAMAQCTYKLDLARDRRLAAAALK